MKLFIFVSKLIALPLLEKLRQIGRVIIIDELKKTYKAISTHPDIQIAVINNQLFMDQDTWNQLLDYDKQQLIDAINASLLTIIDSKLGNRYPLSVPFNGKFLDHTWIHHLKYSDETILDYIDSYSIEKIHTTQGYTGCSLVLLPNKIGITSDVGLSKVLKKHNYQILTISDKHIALESMDYGFIGGCCGVFQETLYVNGDLSQHPDFENIKSFVEKQGFTIYDVPGYPLTDIGSIMFYQGDQL